MSFMLTTRARKSGCGTQADMADTEISKRRFPNLRRYVNLHRDNARSGHSGHVLERSSRLTSIDAETTVLSATENFPVNSRPKSLGGYTVGICPSALRVCAFKSTL
jgi:hypothetical protein